MTHDDIWLQSAMDDTDLAAQILIKLRQSSPSLSSQLKRWTIRQRRSKPQVVDLLPLPQPPATGNKSPAPRASPTTPLSWSGGATSVSGGAGFEESSRLIHDSSRSKVIGPNQTTPKKRPRKKKTLVELKEDETILLNERKQLKQQIETLEARCQKQKRENESLKKMKIDLQSQQLLSPYEIKDHMEGNKDNGFVLPDLNFPAGDDY